MKKPWMDSEDVRFFHDILDELGIDVEELQLQDMGLTELHKAVDEMDTDKMQFLLETGADINARTVLGDTLLYRLIKNHHYLLDPTVERMVELLLNFGADTDAKNYNYSTPFKLAAKMSSEGLVKIMLAKITGIHESRPMRDEDLFNWNEDHSKNGDCSLHKLAVAVFSGYTKTVDRLIDMGYGKELKNDHLQIKKPALYFGFDEKYYDDITMLLEAGLKIDGTSCTSVKDPHVSYDWDLEFICSLWEYGCEPIFKKILCQNLLNFVKTLATCRETYLLLFYYALELRLNRLSKELIPVNGVFKVNSKIAKIFERCNYKLNILKDEIVCGSLSKLDMLSMDLDSLVKYLNIKENLTAIEGLLRDLENELEVRYYEFALKTRIDLALQKRKLLDIAKDNLNESLRDILKLVNLSSLPDEIVWNIFSHLSIKDLKKMQKK